MNPAYTGNANNKLKTYCRDLQAVPGWLFSHLNVYVVDLNIVLHTIVKWFQANGKIKVYIPLVLNKPWEWCKPCVIKPSRFWFSSNCADKRDSGKLFVSIHQVSIGFACNKPPVRESPNRMCLLSSYWVPSAENKQEKQSGWYGKPVVQIAGKPWLITGDRPVYSLKFPRSTSTSVVLAALHWIRNATGNFHTSCQSWSCYQGWSKIPLSPSYEPTCNTWVILLPPRSLKLARWCRLFLTRAHPVHSRIYIRVISRARGP